MLEIDETSPDALDAAHDEVISAETNNTNPVKTIKMGEVTKRYNGAIQYKATFSMPPAIR